MADGRIDLDPGDPRIIELSEAARHIGDAPSGQPARLCSDYRADLRLRILRLREIGHLITLALVMAVYAGAEVSGQYALVASARTSIGRAVGQAHIVSLEQGYRPCGRYRLQGDVARLRFVRVGGVVAAEAPDGRWLTSGGRVVSQGDNFSLCALNPSTHPVIARFVDAPAAALAMMLAG